MNKEGRSKQCRIFRDLCLLKYKKLPAEDASFQEIFHLTWYYRELSQAQAPRAGSEQAQQGLTMQAPGR